MSFGSPLVSILYLYIYIYYIYDNIPLKQYVFPYSPHVAIVQHKPPKPLSDSSCYCDVVVIVNIRIVINTTIIITTTGVTIMVYVH